MTRIIIATHGKLAQELANAAEMICGRQEELITISFMPSDGIEDLTSRLYKALDGLEDEAIIFTDVFGGSPFNAASVVSLKTQGLYHVTGVNLPMLLEVLTTREGHTAEELVEICIKAGKDGVIDTRGLFSRGNERCR
ncbi:PTS sugar transporter subunit IIA [Calorimonas adulescens]|uniref:PTS sugar transporter subunit IIA n=1 Tax=Calorimonas adulescens TaxID=2606906 RepID=UPI001396A2F8|nr:PTS sugar transporter subunit IIA [Calorimonas adulescens]